MRLTDVEEKLALRSKENIEHNFKNLEKMQSDRDEIWKKELTK